MSTVSINSIAFSDLLLQMDGVTAFVMLWSAWVVWETWSTSNWWEITIQWGIVLKFYEAGKVHKTLPSPWMGPCWFNSPVFYTPWCQQSTPLCPDISFQYLCHWWIKGVIKELLCGKMEFLVVRSLLFVIQMLVWSCLLHKPTGSHMCCKCIFWCIGSHQTDSKWALC